MPKKPKPAKSPVAAKRSKAAPSGTAARTARSAMAIATNPRKAVEDRVAALMEAPLAVCNNDETLQRVLGILRNKDEPTSLRLAALQTLQAATFSVVEFESCRSDYIATLRQLVDDPDAELRQRVLGLLAREKDGFAQQKLIEGLQHPEMALVPPEKALQLLGYDPHGEVYPVARDVISNPPNPAARREALRVLAADATAAPMFEAILRDKGESPEARQISAAALHALIPDKFQALAREMLLDPSEHEGIQATSLMALTQFGDAALVAKDEALRKRVDDLSQGSSTEVQQTARKFLGKYGR